MAVACSEIQLPNQPPAEEKEPPTVYVPAGFYVWDSGETSLHSGFSLLAKGIFSESTTLVTYHLAVTTDTPTDISSSWFPPTDYYSDPVTYSKFTNQNLATAVDKMWVYAPTDVTNWTDAVQIFASMSVEVTFPSDSTVPSQLVLMLTSSYASQLSYFVDFDSRDNYYFALTQPTLLEPPPFGFVDTSPEQTGGPNYAPGSQCAPGSPVEVYLYQEHGELFVEATDGPYMVCSGEYNYFDVDIRIRGKLRPAALPPNLAMACTPGVGCAFSP